LGRSLAYIVLLDLWEKFFGTPVRSSMRRMLRESGGPGLEKMGMAGIPALMGVKNPAHRAGLQKT